MRKLFVSLLALVVMLMILPIQPAQAAGKVSVKLSDYAITLNGMSVNNAYRQYPFVVYRDVIYCPLTYYDSRFLGLETNWRNEKGLSVLSTDVVCGFREAVSKKRNAKTLTASVALWLMAKLSIIQQRIIRCWFCGMYPIFH